MVRYYILTGKAELNGDSVKYLKNPAMPIDQIAEKFTKRIKVTLDPRKMTLDDLVKIYELADKNPGNVEIFFEYLQNTEGDQTKDIQEYHDKNENKPRIVEQNR
ncbi:MAG: hypothetical protein IPG53_13255 [Ignavibacteriales bacterium]|nr:hypothetical protein [Ignavibacteriales bacterium]